VVQSRLCPSSVTSNLNPRSLAVRLVLTDFCCLLYRPSLKARFCPFILSLI